MTDDDIALLGEHLSDPIWRLTSGEIYRIKTADGRGIIPFIPRPEQVELLTELVEAVEKVRGRTKTPDTEPQDAPQNVELKARRLGFSTCLGVFIADCLCFRKDFTAQLIDQTADEAAKKMNGIVKVAVDSAIATGWVMKKLKDSDSELTVDCVVSGSPQGSPSTFFAGTKGRGGSLDFAWFSELGVIQFDDPPRAEEIVTGAFPAARWGVKWVETTWKGGKGGKLWDIIQPTIDGKAHDWKVRFSPWWRDPRNRSATAVIDARTQAYFDKIQPRLVRDGIALDEQQRRWYSAEWRTQGIFMKRENPTFLDECWEAPIQGAIYASSLLEAETDGRIVQRLPRADVVVDVFMDLGAPQNSPAWFCQRVGREIRVIDHDVGVLGETIAARWGRWLRKGYNIGTLFLPHDAQQTERTGRSIVSDLRDAGVGQVVTVPRTHDIWTGINALLGMFPSLVFAAETTEAGRNALAAYRTKEVKAGQLSTDEPVHDWASHHADALRTMAEAVIHGLWKVSRNTLEQAYDDDKPKRRKMAVMTFGGWRR